MAGENLYGKPSNGPVLTDPYGGAVWGGNAKAAEDDVNRYRSMGEVASNRAPVQIDYGQANNAIGGVYNDQRNSLATRFDQNNATNMLTQASNGMAPSGAAIRSGMATDQGLRGQLAGNVSGRGPLGQVAGARSALLNAGVFGQQNVGQTIGARAQETGQAQNALATHLGAVRGGDYAAATGMTRLGGLQGDMAAQQGNMDFRQNDLNQGYQQAMENNAFGVRNAAQQALLQSKRRDLGVQQFGYENDQFDNEIQKKWLGSLIGGSTAMGSAMIAGGGGGGGGGPTSTPAPQSTGTGYDPQSGIYRGDPYGSGQVYSNPNTGYGTYGGNF